MRNEWLARMLVIALAGAAIAIPAGGWLGRSRGIVIHARMAETGGWMPENLTVAVGQPLHLRLTSDDVTHGFAIGQSSQSAVDVLPGEITDITLSFDRPGKYTFYCTRWCSINHWRMRGIIEVTGHVTTTEAAKPPLYVALNLDIDAVRNADVVPQVRPSANRGAHLKTATPSTYLSRDEYLSTTPVEIWKRLRADDSLNGLSDQDIWDLVALAWQSTITKHELKEGQQLYAANCAACHGAQGAGDGVFAELLDKTRAAEHTSLQNGEMTERPADFTDPARMLSASPALLQGKLLRGGMGTGMPYWGPIFTEEQTWALVSYLWTFQFDLEDQP
jgi:mono/diheme cytochrome c family protein/plastocyanin